MVRTTPIGSGTESLAGKFEGVSGASTACQDGAHKILMYMRPTSILFLGSVSRSWHAVVQQHPACLGMTIPTSPAQLCLCNAFPCLRELHLDLYRHCAFVLDTPEHGLNHAKNSCYSNLLVSIGGVKLLNSCGDFSSPEIRVGGCFTSLEYGYRNTAGNDTEHLLEGSPILTGSLLIAFNGL